MAVGSASRFSATIKALPHLEGSGDPLPSLEKRIPDITESPGLEAPIERRTALDCEACLLA